MATHECSPEEQALSSPLEEKDINMKSLSTIHELPNVSRRASASPNRILGFSSVFMELFKIAKADVMG